MRGKKFSIQMFVVLTIMIITTAKIYTHTKTENVNKIYVQQKQEKQDKKDFSQTALGESLKSKNYEGKLVTVLTTFVPHGQLNDKNRYRHLTQLNFLQTTLFTSFKAKIQFVVFTNCSYWKEKIQQMYPHVATQNLIIRHPFSTPLLKDMISSAMEHSNTPFYMFTNADNLYDSTLLRTINRMLGAIRAKQLRTKILIIGHRFNTVVREVLRNEEEIEGLMKVAHKSKPFAKDYAIVTRDSFDWLVFPDLVVGRQFFDSYLVDYAFHNEIQTVDATDTIRLVHQEFKRGYSTAMNADRYDNEWNKNIFGKKTSHSSILCANFKTEFERKEILILDKEKSEYLHNNDDNSFFDDHKREWDRIKRCEKHGKYGNATDIVGLTIIILTTNKPDSLSRLLLNINKSVYNNKRIDLRININRGQSGFYDLETLKIASEFDWAHGDKCSHLTNHKDGLSQWIESSNFSDSTPFLLLQDDVTLSTHFYTALSGAVAAYQATPEWQSGGISGISLEPPITAPYSLKSYHQLVARIPGTIVLSRPILSRAFYPNQLVWRQFTEWVRGVKSGVTKFRTSDLADTFAVSQLNNGNKTEWYKGMFGVWFSYFVEMRSSAVGYLLDTKGAIGMWAYRGLDGSENFLSYECSLENVYVKTRIPILSVENPKFRFSPSPSRIEIGT